MLRDVSYEELKNLCQEGIHLVDVYGEHCVPCRMLAAALEQVEQKYPFFSFLKINSSLHPEIIKEYAVRGVPTLLLIEDGTLLKRQTGSMNETRLTEWIGDHLYD